MCLSCLHQPLIISESGLIYWWISLGLGRHSAVLPVYNQQQGPKIIFAAAFLYDAGITFPKFSVLFFYYRIFQRTAEWFYFALWIVGSLCAAWLLGSWLSTMFQCNPVRASWEPVPGAHCISQWKWFLGTATPSMVLDLIILVIPLPMLWGLHVSNIRRVLLFGVFICGYWYAPPLPFTSKLQSSLTNGVSVIVVSVGRLITLAKAGSSLEEDLTWSTIEYIEWVQCEAPISLMSVCLPNTLELGRRLYGRRKPDSSQNTVQGSSKGSTSGPGPNSNGSFGRIEDGGHLIMEPYSQSLKAESTSPVEPPDPTLSRDWV
ncbi:hypothetical protein VTN77DRAFT_2873 [Rasamsonia byssochlamydoides]|uniref:uncharacterized protein n=1 Tax=Rasamsonia byssochlamydoides TaxID=89139 RepID=UPI003744A0BD